MSKSNASLAANRPVPERARRPLASVAVPVLRGAVAALSALAFGTAAAAGAGDAAPYPSRTIRLVVPQSPGGGDFLPRLLGKRLADAVGQPVVIENRPGVSYNIASEFVAKAPADGYTLLYTGSVVTLLPSVLGPVAVDPVAAFDPVAKLMETPLIVVAHRSLGVRTLGELIELARRKPGQVAYATTGVGTLPHLVAETIAQRAGVELLHIPYPNARQLMTDHVAGEVPVYFTFPIAVDAHIRSGLVRPLVVASRQRIAELPDVPTVVELGFEDAAVEPWTGVFVPAGTPRPIVDRLNREFVSMLGEPEIRDAMLKQGMRPVGSTPERLGADVREAVARWPAVVKAAGIRRE